MNTFYEYLVQICFVGLNIFIIIISHGMDVQNVLYRIRYDFYTFKQYDPRVFDYYLNIATKIMSIHVPVIVFFE